MPGNRRAAEAVILEYIEKMMPGSQNTQIYKDLFATMSDRDFDEFMVQLEREEIFLTIQAPNLGPQRLSIERNLEIAKELGHEFFERIWIDEGNDIPPYLSNYKYLVVDLPLRRQAQLLTKKISIPKNNNTVDNLTGQPTGSSKGSKVSYPELQIMAALGLDGCAAELMKYRGGDLKGFYAMNSAISKTGGVELETLDKLGTRVKSTTTLSTYLTAMHLQNTLNQG